MFCFALSFICYSFLARVFDKLFRLDLNSLSRLGRPRIFSPPACTTRLSANLPCELGSAVSRHAPWLVSTALAGQSHYTAHTPSPIMYEDFSPVYPGKSQPNFVAGVAAGGQETDCEIAELHFTIMSRRGETRQVLDRKQADAWTWPCFLFCLPRLLFVPSSNSALHFTLIHSCAPKTTHKL